MDVNELLGLHAYLTKEIRGAYRDALEKNAVLVWLGGHTLEGFLGHVALQRGSNETQAVEGKISDEEVDGGLGTERNDSAWTATLLQH